MTDRLALLEFEQASARAIRSVAAPIEVRTAADGDTLVFDGYACITGHWYDMFGGPPVGWHEQVAPGAFQKTLAEGADVQFLVNHRGEPIARTTAGNLDLEENDQGEHVTARLNPADPDVQRIVPKLQARNLTEMSMAFRVVRQRWEDDDGNEADPMTAPRRRILEINQHRGDVSIVNYGANDATFGQLRGLDHALHELRAGRVLSDEQRAVLVRWLHEIVDDADTASSQRRGLNVAIAAAQLASRQRRRPAA